MVSVSNHLKPTPTFAGDDHAAPVVSPSLSPYVPIMPLNRDMDIQQYVQNREQAGRSSAALPEKRSITPQPNLNRDRTQQLQGDVRLQPRTNSRDRHSHDRPGRDTEMLKLPVPNTIGKPKSNLLSTATGSNKVPDLSEPAPPAAQNTFSRLNPLPKSHREVGVISPWQLRNPGERLMA